MTPSLYARDPIGNHTDAYIPSHHALPMPQTPSPTPTLGYEDRLPFRQLLAHQASWPSHPHPQPITFETRSLRQGPMRGYAASSKAEEDGGMALSTYQAASCWWSEKEASLCMPLYQRSWVSVRPQLSMRTLFRKCCHEDRGGWVRQAGFERCGVVFLSESFGFFGGVCL